MNWRHVAWAVLWAGFMAGVGELERMRAERERAELLARVGALELKLRVRGDVIDTTATEPSDAELGALERELEELDQRRPD